VWAYTRAEKSQPGRIMVREWPFANSPPVVVPDVLGATALAISDNGLRLAVAGRGLTVLDREGPADAWRTTTSIDILPGGGTGDALSFSPDGTLLAHTGARRAVVFDLALRELHREDIRFVSDVEFAPGGDLVAFGDWSAGVVIAWPAPAP
jgi:hypothetical protein